VNSAIVPGVFRERGSCRSCRNAHPWNITSAVGILSLACRHFRRFNRTIFEYLGRRYTRRWLSSVNWLYCYAHRLSIPNAVKSLKRRNIYSRKGFPFHIPFLQLTNEQSCYAKMYLLLRSSFSE